MLQVEKAFEDGFVVRIDATETILSKIELDDRRLVLEILQHYSLSRRNEEFDLFVSAKQSRLTATVKVWQADTPLSAAKKAYDFLAQVSESVVDELTKIARFYRAIEPLLRDAIKVEATRTVWKLLHENRKEVGVQ